jgi:hypothetical protein
MVAIVDGQDSNVKASGPRSVGSIHKLAANQSIAGAARQVFRAYHLRIRDRHLKPYTMVRGLSEYLVVSLGACNKEELGDVDRKLRDCLEIGGGPSHWFYGLETG